MISWAPTKYKTTNWSSYNNALKQRGSLSIWLDPEMVWVPPPRGKRGRQQQFSDAAIQACLTLKVLFGMLLRQTTGFVESLLRLAGLDWAVPDYSTLCRRQKTLSVTLPYHGGTGPPPPPHRQCRHQGRGRRRVERAQAWRPETPDMAQDTYRDRRGNTGGPSC
jgi:hypothetical protein